MKRFALLAAMVLASLAGPLPAQGPFAEVDRLIQEAVDRNDIPGAVVWIGRGDQTLHRQALGWKQIRPVPQAMTLDTVFDLASLTKPLATATAIVRLASEGKLDLQAPAARYLPEFGVNGKETITLEQLLTHRSGLIADNPLSDYQQGPAEAHRKLMQLAPRHPPGSRFVYSDVGYLVLGEVVHRVSGKPLDVYAREHLFIPADMPDTGYRPGEMLRHRLAPTTLQEGRWLIGEVHDPRARLLGGVAGHAGVFSTAQDLSRFCRLLLNGGAIDGRQVLSPQAVALLTQPLASADGIVRTRGFDGVSPYDSARGLRMPAGTSFGHTGFTGTMFWIDPASGLYVILLTHRVHPDGAGRVVDLRRAVATVAAETALGPEPGVLTGIDVLVRRAFHPLAGERVGLITNVTGISRQQERTIDLLHRSATVKLVKIFSPEHGLGAKAEGQIADAVDPATQLPIFSLYGQTRRPTPAMLADLDTLVFDIQDIGTRFYTYISTLGYAMEEASKHGKKIVVLDRPNPIGGLAFDGPLPDADLRSFVCYADIPVTHGMTAGELARLFNQTLTPPCNLQVIEMRGWKRGMTFADVHQPWVNPSPNIRNLRQAQLYPAVGLLEMTDLSVGRGTPTPFELFGAPWIDPASGAPQRLADRLNASALPGLRFHPVTFTPDASKFTGQLCGGVKIELTDPALLQPARSGLTIAWHLKNLSGGSFNPGPILTLLNNRRVLDQAMTRPDPAALSQLADLWREDLARFAPRREAVLIYGR